MNYMKDPKNRPVLQAAGGCLLVTGLFLTAILVPLSFATVEYYEYGLEQRRRSGRVQTDNVYTNGRYMLGPGKSFLTYPSDAHFESFVQLGVFSSGQSNASVGLTFEIDVDFTYFLKQDEVGILHEQMASTYKTKIRSETEPAIKNEAATVTFEEYFMERKMVEERFAEAVQRRWDDLDLHCTLDQFFLGRVRITDKVAEKQLATRIQNEVNDRESYLQTAEIERQQTEVTVNSILLQADNILQTAQAQAGLVRARATTEAREIEADAQTEGTMLLFEAADIRSQEHMTAFTYIRTLAERDQVELSINYLASENVLKTQAIN